MQEEWKNITAHCAENIDFVRRNNVDIAVLTIPKTSAVKVAAQLTEVGIRGIWNFAHVDLEVPADVKVENVHLSDSLMRLSYMIGRSDENEWERSLNLWNIW